MTAADRFLRKEDLVQEYPGGISSIPRRRFLYAFTPEFILLMESVSSGLFEWTRPQLPEDFHLLRSDGSTVLGSVTSEEQAYLRLSDPESLHWLDQWPTSIALQE